MTAVVSANDISSKCVPPRPRLRANPAYRGFLRRRVEKADSFMNSKNRPLCGPSEMQLGEVKQNSVDPGSRHSVDEPPSIPRSAFALMLVFGGGLGNDQLGCKRRTWNTVLFRSPCSQIRDLTTLRTEWTPRICFPCRGLVAQGAGHGRSVTSEPNEVQSLEGRLISSSGCLLGFLDLGPRVFE